MATSSILTNFTITEKKAAERFVKALVEASELPPIKLSDTPVKYLRDPEDIKKLLAKDKENDE